MPIFPSGKSAWGSAGADVWPSTAPALRWGRMDAYQQVIDVLAACKRVLVTTHVRPDGDALGSTAALVLGLKQRGIHAEVLLLSHLPEVRLHLSGE